MKKTKTGIDIKQFKKFIEKEYGIRCPEYYWNCQACNIYRLYDEIESLIKEEDTSSVKHFI